MSPAATACGDSRRLDRRRAYPARPELPGRPGGPVRRRLAHAKIPCRRAPGDNGSRDARSRRRQTTRPVSVPATPHDALFRALVSNPSRAGALLADYLPREVADLLDPGTPPEAVEGSIVDA